VSKFQVAPAGPALVIPGARRRSGGGAHLILGGPTRSAGAAAGYCNPRDAAIRWRCLTQRHPDRVTSDLMDSFPASDPSSSSAIAFGVAVAL